MEDRNDPNERETPEQWLARRKEAALHLNPETAEVSCTYVQILDPYGIHPNLSDECLGRECFARAPDSDVWVWFGDLPRATREALRARGKDAMVSDDDIPF